MDKSKLGITVTLFGALLYFLVATGNVFASFVAVGYVLLFEESEKLKRTAIKALFVALVFFVIVAVISRFSSVFAMMLSGLLNYSNTKILDPMNAKTFPPYLISQIVVNVPYALTSLAQLFEVIIPVLFGIRAFRGKDIKIQWIDKIIDDHFSKIRIDT